MISVADAHKRVDELALLEEDWDSYGAKAIPAKVIARAHELIDTFTYMIQWVSPLGTGGLQIEWAFFNELELEIYLDDDGHVVMDSALVIRTYRTHDNVSIEELVQLHKFGTGVNEGNRNYEENKKRAAARGEDVSKW